MDFSFLNNDLFITKIVLACYVKRGTGRPVHTLRPSHGVALCVSGESVYTFKSGETSAVKKGDIIYLPKYSSYTVSHTEQSACYAINFQLSEDKKYPPFAMRINEDTDLLRSFTKAEAAFQKQQPAFAEKCCRELYNILYLLKRAKAAAYEPKRDMLSEAVAYISENYTKQNIGINELCRLCGISDTYLRTLFKSAFDMTPIEYIVSMRLSYARSLLLSGEYSVTDACFTSGFNDTSHFSRTFKKYYGISPQTFLRMNK